MCLRAASVWIWNVQKFVFSGTYGVPTEVLVEFLPFGTGRQELVVIYLTWKHDYLGPLILSHVYI